MVDCVGSADSVAQALSMVKPTGRVVLAGMPGHISIDMAGLWHSEIELVGAYAYGVERSDALSGTGSPRRTFDIAFELVSAAGLGKLVSHLPPRPLRRSDRTRWGFGPTRRGENRVRPAKEKP